MKNLSKRTLTIVVVFLAAGVYAFDSLRPATAETPGAKISPMESMFASRARPDPCEQALDVPGNANGLNKRCDAIGTGGGAAKGDFNGDGFADLAVGVPQESVNGETEAGGVNVIYGSANGLTSAGDQFLDASLWGGNTANSHFGWALAAGDFNGDGNSDLAIGEPHHPGIPLLTLDSGNVYVIYGTATGLSLAGPVFNEVGDYGAALVWGDFNGDGKADLAIGAPTLTFNNGVRGAGAVEVLYGTSFGLSESGATLFSEGFPRRNGSHTQIGGLYETDDNFGSVLAASRRGVYDDLVIGVPREDIGLNNPTKDAGAVYVIKGTSGGLEDDGSSQMLSQDTSGVQGGIETGDQFGRSLAIGDFNGDGSDDLAVGVPFEDLTYGNAGAVQIFFGASGSNIFTTTDNRFISQSVIPGVAQESLDQMAWSLAAGDFDRDGRDDLAIGVPGEDVGGITDAGLVTILYGNSTGPSLTRVQNFTQGTSGIPSDNESGDQFGYALSAWNYGYGLEADLAIGVPYEDVGSLTNAGSVYVIYGNPTGLSTSAHPAQIWNQDSPNIKGVAQTFDHFGQALY